MATTMQIQCLSDWCASEKLNLDNVRKLLRERPELKATLPRAGRVLLIGLAEGRAIKSAMSELRKAAG